MPDRATVARRGRALIAALTVTAAATGGLLGSVAASAATPTTYYVAMGDSLASGFGANPISDSYVQRVYQHELARIPGLVLRNFSCPGATTSSVVNSHGCGASVTQLEKAQAFLQAHPGHIAFLTIDIGGNDVDGCSNAPDIQACIDNGLAAINTNLPQILSTLKAASPGIKVFGMNYYDPFLSTWLTGPSGEALAQQSVVQADAFNAMLTNLYAASGFPTADVATAFQTDDFSLTGTYNGQSVPQNVANVCNWTGICALADIHANNDGHAVLARSFQTLIDPALAPTAPRSVSATPGDGAASVRWAAPASDHGSPITGYTITAYRGTTLAKIVQLGVVTHSTVTELTNGRAYTFRVAARNALGSSPRASTLPTVVGAPRAPVALSAAAGAGRATLHWTAPANNGAPITAYVVTPYLAGVAQPARTFAATTTTRVVTALSAANTYQFKVAARNLRGTGPQSLASNAITPT